MTPKNRLKLLLDGGIPDLPPHWELVFQIPKEMFGIDLDAALGVSLESGRAAYSDISVQLSEECQWAAIPAINGYDPEEVRLHRKKVESFALTPGYEGGGVFWLLPGDQMEEFALRLYEDREALHQEARLKCECAKKSLTQLADAGPDFFMLCYDFGYNQAPFISPAHFRDLIAPYLAEIVDHAHQLGKKAMLHSDGCLDPILDTIVATGIDGYQSIDPQGHMDIRDVRRRYPELLLMGNVPCSLLQTGTPEQVRSAVHECLTYGGVGKRYVFSTSNCIFGGMPPESYRHMLSEYHQIIAGIEP